MYIVSNPMSKLNFKYSRCVLLREFLKFKTFKLSNIAQVKNFFANKGDNTMEWSARSVIDVFLKFKPESTGEYIVFLAHLSLCSG